jgi:hypothetical protein
VRAEPSTRPSSRALLLPDVLEGHRFLAEARPGSGDLRASCSQIVPRNVDHTVAVVRPDR